MRIPIFTGARRLSSIVTTNADTELSASRMSKRVRVPFVTRNAIFFFFFLESYDRSDIITRHNLEKLSPKIV